MENSHVYLKISAESIYLHSISILSFYSIEKFEINLSTEMEIIQLIKGKQGKSNKILSQKGDCQNYVVEISVIGLFDERKVISGSYDDKLGNRYGMRFYPFISSFIKGTIYCSRKIENISIILPDIFRLIFFKSKIKQNNKESILRHSYGNDSSTFIFTWKNEVNETDKYTLVFDIPVRYGGTSLLRMTQFPVFYWIIALLGISILSLTERTSIVVGAIATTWLFLLQRWNSSFVPQKNTILTKSYLIYGAVLGVWGIMWETCGLWAMFLLLPVFVIVYFTLKAISLFENTGELPKSFAESYAKKIIENDEKLYILSKKKGNTGNRTSSTSLMWARRPVRS
ncbi:hypothetical protein CBG53_00960 [Porphyromonas gingivalis]|nr:hypothetical protein HMPREF1554_00547 [Porphyromonas gingivalis F0569]OWP34500.1 hypothetical protein CBG53_00960 [Porphyromonas gingivalis]OWR77825.1 hypothetical protein SJDPG11_07220 [Porphyromonas gingivalis SJD11]